MKLAWPGKTGRYGFEKDPLAATMPAAGSSRSVVRHDDELAAFPAYRRHARVGMDLDGERGGQVLEVVSDLVTVRVAVRVSPGTAAPGIELKAAGENSRRLS